MVDLSKFTSNKNILKNIVVFIYMCIYIYIYNLCCIHNNNNNNHNKNKKTLMFQLSTHHIKEKLWLRNSKQRRGCTCEQPLVFVLLFTVFVHGKSELNGRLFTKTLHQPFDIFSAEKKKKKKKNIWHFDYTYYGNWKGYSQ